MSFQLYVDDEDRLSLMMTQRSGDLGLGVPFNVASYAMLAHFLAHLTGREAGTLTHVIGDAHVYINHIDALRHLDREFVKETPCAIVRISEDVKSLDDIREDRISVINYKYKEKIKLVMSL